MIGASMFVGWASTLLWLPPIADRRGRKNIFWLGMVIDLVLFTGLMLTHEFIVMIFL